MKIIVTPAELTAAAGAIEGLAGDYAQHFNALFSDVGSLQSAWQGKDNQAFTTQINGFKDDFERMKQLMDDYAAFLRNAANSYTTTQNNITEAAGRLSTGN